MPELIYDVTDPGGVWDQTPKRIQRKRTKGWRMPEGSVYVGRPTRWGNPYPVGTGNLMAHGECAPGWVGAYEVGEPVWFELSLERGLTAQDVCDLYRSCLLLTIETGEPEEIVEALKELRGRDLACWCPLDQPCHADVLLEIANA